MRQYRSGFTLIELIIVIVIIGILASISAPMLGNMKAKAICAEALANMSAIRSALQEYRIQNNSDYPSVTRWVIAENALYFPGLSLRNSGSDYGSSATNGKYPTLDGLYFSQESYYIYNRVIFCYVKYGGNKAPRAAEADLTTDIPGDQWPWITLDMIDGKIKQYKWTKTGYPPYY